MSSIDDFQNKIDTFLESLLINDTSYIKDVGPKIIHDSVWGTNIFHPWEIALIDCPILQRLRRIHQTGLAFLVYPTSTHTRFEHSLGVTILVEKLINHLNINSGEELISKQDKYNLRLSALLHDVGHSFFSHVSELVYERMKIFQDLKNEINALYRVEPKGHEIFSFLILKSKLFRDYFSRLISKLPISDEILEYLKNIDWDIIAGYIIGYSPDPSKKYLADIINGPIDCDKLDYLARDARFAGPVIVYDIDRYFYTINTINSGDHKRLTVTLSGITALEQIVISRMMLFSYIYHHHKVRSAEAMMKRLCFDLMYDNKPKSENAPDIQLKHPADFLKYTDETILNSLIGYYDISDIPKNVIQDLLNRRLWIRSQMISGFNIAEEKPNVEFTQLEKDLFDEGNIQELKKVKRMLIEKVKEYDHSINITERDIWIDVPPSPPADEAKQFMIKKKHNIEEHIPLLEVFPLVQWVDAYKANKWRAHIFCKRKFQKAVYEASKTVLIEYYNMTVLPFTEDFCKVRN